MAKKIARQRGQRAADHVGGDDDAVGADAGVARRLLVLADREEIAAEDRAVQHHRHARSRDDERSAIEGCAGHAEGAAGGQPFERRESSAPKAKPAVASSV